MTEQPGPGQSDIPPKDRVPADKTPKVDRKEGEARYDKLVLGHPLHEIDIDQIVSMKVAQMLGLVPEGVPVECVPHVDDTALENPTVLAVEGFDSTRPGTNTLETGNFHNGAADEPAAYMLLTSVMTRVPDKNDPKYTDDGTGKFNRKLYSEDFNKALNSELGRMKVPKDARMKLQQLVWHLARSESRKKSRTEKITGKPPSERNEFDDVLCPDLLSYDDLDVFAKITGSIRDKIIMDDEGNKEERIFTAITEVTNELFDTSRTVKLSAIYGELLESVEEQKKTIRKELSHHFLKEDSYGKTTLNTRHLRMIKVSAGTRTFNVTYADISGKGIRWGGPWEAIETVRHHTRSDDNPRGEQTDVLVFVNDEFGPDGKPNGKKKVMVRIPPERSGKVPLDLKELATRLNESEALFGDGKPLVTVASYGGHTELIATPQFVGTGMEPTNMFVGIQSHLEAPRYTTEQFEAEAARFAEQIDTSTYTIQIEKPLNKYEIAQRSIVIAAPGREPIAITESDLPLFQAVMGGDRKANLAMVMEKTAMNEPKAVEALRTENARIELIRHLEEGNAPKMLEAMQHLSHEYIDALHGDVLLRMFDLIADDPVAISMVYNKMDTRFGIVGENTAEWMIQNPERYREMIHEYRSTVQSKVDWTLNHAIMRYVTDSRDVTLQERYAFAMEKILLSKPYRKAHADSMYQNDARTYDNHLNAMLRFVANADNDRLLRKAVARAVGVNYGPEMKAHWEDVALYDKTAFTDAFDAFPEELAEVVDAIEIDTSRKTIEGVPGSRIYEPTAEGIAASIQEQRERGVQRPIITFLVQISGRDTESMLQAKGIWLDTRSDKRMRIEFGTPDAKIKIGRWLKQEGKDRSYDQSEDPRVADEMIRIIKMIDELDPEPDPSKKAMIRVIRDGFSGPLDEDYDRKISTPHPRSKRKELLDFDIQKRLIHCTYMQGEKTYCDRIYLPEDQEEE